MECDYDLHRYAINDAQTILSDAPQSSVLGPVILNFYINDLFLFNNQATLYNYDDYSTLTFCKTCSNLIGILEKEAGVALNWLK